MNLCVLVLCLLLCASSCLGDKGAKTGLRAAAGSKSVTLQPWLVGLTAVVGFLFIVFVVLIVHRLLRKNRKDENSCNYENITVEVQGDETKQTSL
ncbi:hypothetical protein KUCAC02_022524 [Chaenocephalus aceratus]|uniref:Uncharacterized protein n=1 Tax=Chaenocephalus aceratus TaxID=36190 RepID=A0ACB9XPA1_CHAAC|nr:hypothetical protein KUCAC02_022524 [Chaenocephalus aceratus]